MFELCVWIRWLDWFGALTMNCCVTLFCCLFASALFSGFV